MEACLAEDIIVTDEKLQKNDDPLAPESSMSWDSEEE